MTSEAITTAAPNTIVFSNGNLGIGTTTPSNSLAVYGDFKAGYGNSTTTMVSAAGTTWVTRTSAAENQWTHVIWVSTLNLYCAVAYSGTGTRVMTSTNGLTWVTRTSAADNGWWSVVWAPSLSLLCAVADSTTGTAGTRVMTSPDGITWQTRTSASDIAWRDVTWSPALGLFAAVSQTGTGNRVMTSTNAITWVTRTTNNNSWLSVTWSPELGIFCAVGDTGTGNRVMTSTNGITWITRTTNNNNWHYVVWAPELSLFCAVAYSGTGDRVMTSPDGITWTARTSAADNNWYRITWAPEIGLFCATASSGTCNRVMTSPDGTTWTVQATNDNQWWGAAWSSTLRRFAVVAYSGTGDRVMTSEDITTSSTNTLVFQNGQLGVGTNAPRERLEVQGSIIGVMTFRQSQIASGTAVDFTGIPSWAKRITVVFNGVSGNGSSQTLVQIGTDGVLATSGYSSYWTVPGATNSVASTSSTAGFGIWTFSTLDIVQAAHMTLVNINSTTWIATHSGGLYNGTNNYSVSGGGNVTLIGPPNILRVTHVNGTDVFDAGTINITYEG